MDRKTRETPADQRRIQRYDHPESTGQEADRHRQPRKSAAGSSPKGKSDRRRLPVPSIGSLLWGG